MNRQILVVRFDDSVIAAESSVFREEKVTDVSTKDAEIPTGHGVDNRAVNAARVQSPREGFGRAGSAVTVGIVGYSFNATHSQGQHR